MFTNRDKISLRLCIGSLVVYGLAPMHVAHAAVLPAPQNEVTVTTNGGVNMTFNDPCSAPLASSQSSIKRRLPIRQRQRRFQCHW